MKTGLSSLAALLAAALFACAPPRAASTTTTTSADAVAHAEAEPAPREAIAEPAPPPGQLACRTVDAFGVRTSLWLEWSGSAARGVLRAVAPSGAVTERRVHAERYEDMLIIDDPGQVDLVDHVAVVRSAGGKKVVRLADAGDAWSTCE